MMTRPPSPEYTAKDILGVNGETPVYKGGLKAYRRDKRAHTIYRAWHTYILRGRKI